MDLWFTEYQKDGFGITIKVKESLFHEVSEFQTVDIIDTEAFGRMLLLDGLVMTSEKDEFFYHEMISHIPMLSHPAPKKVLVIGGGDGGTVREVLKHSSVEKVVLCEIDSFVVDACRRYLPTIAGVLDDPRVDIQIRDGIDYIAEQKDQFDIILVDSTDPMGPGEGLFTEEFYKNVNAALKQGGIMAAQSESPVANKREMSLMYPLLRKAFPIVSTFVGPIPTYPGGYWSWAFCSNDVKPLGYFDEARANEITISCKLYNSDIQKAAFVLPNFVKEIVKEVH
ncbi:MAG: polyamine aminopropyltransferase [Candidatus Gastranaerophilales bacterium]|nr:polyamine aminopropyltransferase [Candidatus Gastranaerophilales bacterium]